MQVRIMLYITHNEFIFIKGPAHENMTLMLLVLLTILQQGRGRHSRSQSVDIEAILSLQITSEEEEEEEERGRGRERGAERGGGRERGLRGTEREGGRRERESFSSSDAKEALSEPENVHHHYGGMCLMRNLLIRDTLKVSFIQR